jgi:eukaryotic-like serine/threonine-protein kinase
LSRVSSWGGTPTELTKLDTSRSEAGHRWPVFLPDGKHFIYLAANFSGRPGINAIFLGSLDSTEKRFLVGTSANAFYSEPGYLLYMRDKTLVAQSFDLRHFALSGEPHTLSNEVLYFPQVYRAAFSVSGPEMLVTHTGKGVYLAQLKWFDRNGNRSARLANQRDTTTCNYRPTDAGSLRTRPTRTDEMLTFGSKIRLVMPQPG